MIDSRYNAYYDNSPKRIVECACSTGQLPHNNTMERKISFFPLPNVSSLHEALRS